MKVDEIYVSLPRINVVKEKNRKGNELLHILLMEDIICYEVLEDI